MSKPVEILMYEFLKAAADAAVDGDPFFEIDVHDTIYQKIDKPTGLRVSAAVSSQVPIGLGEVKEFDAHLTVVCFARVEGKDQKQRAAAMQKVYELQTATVKLLNGDPTLGGRVCDLLVAKKIPRDFDSLDSNPFAVVNIPVTINPSDETSWK